MPDPAVRPGGDPVPERGSLIGFDFGLARIGVAVGEIESGVAHALETIAGEAQQPRFARIGALIAEWRPILLVVGLPTRPDGGEHELTRRCRRFAHQLHGRFGVPVELMDERFSSLQAERTLAEAGRHGRAAKPLVDAVAAQVILQHFLDLHAHAHSTAQR